jgi:hypothetical protein
VTQNRVKMLIFHHFLAKRNGSKCSDLGFAQVTFAN